MEDDELSFITSKISVSFSKSLVLKTSSCRKWSAVISTHWLWAEFFSHFYSCHFCL